MRTPPEKFGWIPCKNSPHVCIAKSMTRGRPEESSNGTKVFCTTCGRKFVKNDKAKTWQEYA